MGSIWLFLYNGRHAKSEKVGGGVGWIISRSGWLLELLTELNSLGNSENSVARKFVLGFPSFIARKVCDKTGEIEFGHLLGNINL